MAHKAFRREAVVYPLHIFRDHCQCFQTEIPAGKPIKNAGWSFKNVHLMLNWKILLDKGGISGLDILLKSLILRIVFH
jgi:hypothetical protein